MKKHTSSVEEIVANDVRAWIAQALNCAYKNKIICPLLNQMKAEVKSMERLIDKQQRENNDT